MKLTIDELKELFCEKYTTNETDEQPLSIASGEHILFSIEHHLNNPDLENKQKARLQLWANSPELAKTIADIIETSTNIIIQSKDPKAFDALHRAFHVLKKVMDEE